MHMLRCGAQLKEGTDTSQGIGQVVSNINACVAIVDLVRTTLGPRGMDKCVARSPRPRAHTLTRRAHALTLVDARSPHAPFCALAG